MESKTYLFLSPGSHVSIVRLLISLPGQVSAVALPLNHARGMCGFVQVDVRFVWNGCVYWLELVGIGSGQDSRRLPGHPSWSDPSLRLPRVRVNAYEHGDDEHHDKQSPLSDLFGAKVNLDHFE